MYSFNDKNGRPIMPGATIQHNNGQTELVYATVDINGDESLGIMATNPDFLKNHPDWDIEYYSLRQFNLAEWEILTLPYAQLKELFTEHERSKPSEHLTAHIVFTEDTWDKIYPLCSRTYVISSYNKAFRPSMGGYSIFGDCLDGTDRGVRLEAYMAEEKGGKNGWKIDYCYLIKE